MTALVRVELTQAQVGALVAALVVGKPGFAESQQQGALRQAAQLLADALAVSLFQTIAPADARKPAMGETPKKKRGRPAGKAVSTGPNALPLNARCAKVDHVVSDATPGRCGYCGDKLPETAPALPGIGGAS